MSTHSTPHSSLPFLHELTQLPSPQTLLPLHTLPHAPQLVRSFCVSVQSPLHTLKLGGHTCMHSPPRHIRYSPSHGASQAPQCFGESSVSTQLPLHSVVPGGHSLSHTPITQNSLGRHGRLQPPQWSMSICGSMHESPQICSPTWQLSTQPPSTHTCVIRHG